MRISTTKSKKIETKQKRIKGMGSNGKKRKRKQSDKKRKILFFL